MIHRAVISRLHSSIYLTHSALNILNNNLSKMSSRHHLGLWHWRTLSILLLVAVPRAHTDRCRKFGSFSPYKIKRHICDALHMLILAHSTHQSWAEDIHHPAWLELYCPIFKNFPKGWCYTGHYLFLLIYESSWRHKIPNTTSELCW